MEEEWKEIIDCPGYFISNFGNVKSKKYPDRLLKPNTLSNGYHQYRLSNDGECFTFKASRLVAKYFIDGYDDNFQVDHVDHDKTNNKVSNLRYATQSQNNTNRRGYGRSKYKGVSFSEKKQRWEVRIANSKIKKRFGSYETEIEAAKIYNEKLKELGLVTEYTILNDIPK